MFLRLIVLLPVVVSGVKSPRVTASDSGLRGRISKGPPSNTRHFMGSSLNQGPF